MKTFIHKEAEVDQTARVGEGSKVWRGAQIREHAVIGKNCTIGSNVYIDEGVTIGDNCKIQNNASIYKGVVIESGVFIGPHVCFTNDKSPRAINLQGEPKSTQDWKVTETTVKYGASIGAGSTIICGVIIGRFAMIGAGSVVTKSVDEYALVYGNPARSHGSVDEEGNIVSQEE